MAAGVVALDERRAERAELEHRHRRRRDRDPLEEVEGEAGEVRDRGLDRIGVRHDHDDRLAGMVGDERLDRGDHARLHRDDRLAAGEPDPRRRGLHGLPELESSSGRTSFSPVHSP